MYGGVTYELPFLCDAAILEPLLKISIERAGLEESVAKEHRGFASISVYFEYAHTQENFVISYEIINLGFSSATIRSPLPSSFTHTAVVVNSQTTQTLKSTVFSKVYNIFERIVKTTEKHKW